MKLYEYEGKNLFEKYGIPLPRRVVLKNARGKIPFPRPYVLKAQTLSGNRKKAGGILFAETKYLARVGLRKLFEKTISSESVERVMVEEKIPTSREYYVSFSYSTDIRGPVLTVSQDGGFKVVRAKIFPIDPLVDTPPFRFRQMLKEAKFASEDLFSLSMIVRNLSRLFMQESALLAEINPLIKTPEGAFVAADAKIILDDEKIGYRERQFLEMDGDIAILASGGGASLLNIDTLILAGGRPANYTEYSGNPPAEVVADLTHRVLSQKNLRACWVVGGTANFTDIYETMRGFIDGLHKIRPKPTYPIVIRRDGPRRKEAMAILHKIATEEGYNFHIYDSKTAMAETAKIVVKLAYARKK